VGHSGTHRYVEDTASNDELDTLFRGKTVDATCGKEVRCILGTTQDLEQYGDTGRLERNTIDGKETES
jgi:hypothetical protein